MTAGLMGVRVLDCNDMRAHDRAARSQRKNHYAAVVTLPPSFEEEDTRPPPISCTLLELHASQACSLVQQQAVSCTKWIAVLHTGCSTPH